VEAKDILWQQLQQKQKCVKVKNSQLVIEIDVVCVEGLVDIIEILAFAGCVCEGWRIMVKYLG
jgi:hypothetical protein